MKVFLKMIVVAGGFMLISNGQSAIASNTTYPSSRDVLANFMAMKVSEFIKLPAKDFNHFTGKKLNLKERISFSLLKKSMKKSLKSHPDQTGKDYLATIHKKGKNTTLVIILVVLAVLILVAFIVLSTMNISFGGG